MDKAAHLGFATLSLCIISTTELVGHRMAVTLVNTRWEGHHLFITAIIQHPLLGILILAMMGRRICHLWLRLQAFTDMDALFASTAGVAETL